MNANTNGMTSATRKPTASEKRKAKAAAERKQRKLDKINQATPMHNRTPETLELGLRITHIPAINEAYLSAYLHYAPNDPTCPHHQDKSPISNHQVKQYLNNGPLKAWGLEDYQRGNRPTFQCLTPAQVHLLSSKETPELLNLIHALEELPSDQVLEHIQQVYLQLQRTPNTPQRPIANYREFTRTHKHLIAYANFLTRRLNDYTPEEQTEFLTSVNLNTISAALTSKQQALQATRDQAAEEARTVIAKEILNGQTEELPYVDPDRAKDYYGNNRMPWLEWQLMETMRSYIIIDTGNYLLNRA